MVVKGNEATMNDTLANVFGDMPDPRVVGRCDHKLLDIVVISICAVLCGAEGWEEIAQFGTTKVAWLRQFLDLPNGIPSHDTFRRVFMVLDAEVFQARFMRWVEQAFRVKRGQVVALDGKTVCGSAGLGQSALHLVSAWASESGLVLGQQRVAEKSNEITAIPVLLQELYVAGCIVTIDAMGCQTEIARTIIEQQADYVLALKGNQGHLHANVQDWFAWAHQQHFRNMPHSFHQTVNKGHGRLEIRTCWALSDPQAFDTIRHHDGWVGLQSIVMVERQRILPDKHEREITYFISSLPADAQRLLAAIRHHWAIENSLHWVMDITFGEDDARLRRGDTPENFAVLRHIALNLLKQHPAKMSLKRKRFQAALDDHFLFELLSQV